MKFYKSLISSFKNFEYNGPLDFSSFDFGKYFPLLGIKDCSVEFEDYRNEEEKLMVYVYAQATLSLSDARDSAPFDSPIEVESEFQILDSIGEEGEGYVYKENAIEVEELVLLVLKSEIPLAPTRSDSTLPPSGEGYDVLKEEDVTDDPSMIILPEEKEEP